MKVAPPSPFEAQRLQRLRELGIMDTLPDAAFDAITELAAQMGECPIALITLVDEDRQWFKSRVGLQVTQTAREFAFCAHAILQPQEVMLVEDALRDERFFDNPLVTGEPNIRFYAGAPIVTPDGLALGTVCLIDHVPRQLSAQQAATLRALATAVQSMIQHANAGIVARVRDIENLKERERQLEATVELLEQKTLQQQKYFHLLSHDLREPLNAIRNFMGLIQMECAEILPQDSLRHVDNAIRGSDRMRALIDDLRRFMEIESYQMETEDVGLNDVIGEAWQDLNDAVRRQNARLAVAALPVVQGSPSLLRILFQNLFSNAIKYAREGVAPQVTLSGEIRGHTLVVSVADNGIGIPREHHDEIFLPSRRLHSRRISPGSGLGLPMCRRIAEMHGGAITVQSVEGKGSTFAVELPGAVRAPGG